MLFISQKMKTLSATIPCMILTSIYINIKDNQKQVITKS